MTQAEEIRILKARNRILIRQLKKYEYLANFLLTEKKVPFAPWLGVKLQTIKALLKGLEND